MSWWAAHVSWSSSRSRISTSSFEKLPVTSNPRTLEATYKCNSFVGASLWFHYEKWTDEEKKLHLWLSACCRDSSVRITLKKKRHEIATIFRRRWSHVVEMFTGVLCALWFTRLNVLTQSKYWQAMEENVTWTTSLTIQQRDVWARLITHTHTHKPWHGDGLEEGNRLPKA